MAVDGLSGGYVDGVNVTEVMNRRWSSGVERAI